MHLNKIHSIFGLTKPDDLTDSHFNRNEDGFNNQTNFEKLKYKIENFREKTTKLIAEMFNFVNNLKDNLGISSSRILLPKKTVFQVNNFTNDDQLISSLRNSTTCENRSFIKKKRVADKVAKEENPNTIKAINRENHLINSSEYCKLNIDQKRNNIRKENKNAISLNEAERLLDQSKLIKKSLANKSFNNFTKNLNVKTDEITFQLSRDELINPNEDFSRHFHITIDDLNEKRKQNDVQNLSPLKRKGSVSRLNSLKNFNSRLVNYSFHSNSILSPSFLKGNYFKNSNNNNFTSNFFNEKIKFSNNITEFSNNNYNFCSLPLNERSHFEINDNLKHFQYSNLKKDSKNIINGIYDEKENISNQLAFEFLIFNSEKNKKGSNFAISKHESIIKNNENDDITFNNKTLLESYKEKIKGIKHHLSSKKTYEKGNCNNKNDTENHKINESVKEEINNKRLNSTQKKNEDQKYLSKYSILNSLQDPKKTKLVSKESLDNFIECTDILKNLYNLDLDIEEIEEKISYSDLNRNFDNPRPKKYRMFSAEFKRKCVELTKNIDIKIVSKRYKVPLKSLKRWIIIGYERKKGGGRKIKDPQMERKLSEWIHLYCKIQGNPITAKMIKNKALEFKTCNDFIASKGWLEKFKKKYNLKILREKDLIKNKSN